MISFFSIAYFRQRLDALLSIKRGIYAGVNIEIRNAFEEATIDEIRNNRDMILLDNPLIVIKLRLPDRKHKLAKKDGFRLIYLTYKDEDKVVFLDIYPKRGPFQKVNLSDSELLDLLEMYNVEMETHQLEEYCWNE